MTHQRRPNENPPARRPVTLTRREKQIIRLVASGMSNKSVARLLAISGDTVEWHLRRIYRKFNVHNRTSAVLLAMRAGFISKL
jgi:DNA-binding CsgD family transcriptional regulator